MTKKITKKKTTTASKVKSKKAVKKGITKAELNLRIAEEEEIKTEAYIKDLADKNNILNNEIEKQDDRWLELLSKVGSMCLTVTVSILIVACVIVYKLM